MDSDFKKFVRTNVAEMRELNDDENLQRLLNEGVSVSVVDQDLANQGSPLFREGYVARNPQNHEDQWYVSKAYADENFVQVDELSDNLKASLKDKFKILRYFEYAHLPAHLQSISKPYHDMAYQIAARPTTDYAELVVALRKLKESKDCAVCVVLPN